MGLRGSGAAEGAEGGEALKLDTLLLDSTTRQATSTIGGGQRDVHIWSASRQAGRQQDGFTTIKRTHKCRISKVHEECAG